MSSNDGFLAIKAVFVTEIDQFRLNQLILTVPESWILGLKFNLEKPQKCVDLTVQEGPCYHHFTTKYTNFRVRNYYLLLLLNTLRGPIEYEVWENHAKSDHKTQFDVFFESKLNMKSKLSASCQTRAFRLKRFSSTGCSAINSAIIMVYHSENQSIMSINQSIIRISRYGLRYGILISLSYSP